MKKFVALVACIVLALSIVGCTNGSSQQTQSADKSTASQLVEYYQNSGVSEFISSIAGKMTTLLSVAVTGSETEFTTAYNDLVTLSDKLSMISNVPEKLKASHQKLIESATKYKEAANYLNQFRLTRDASYLGLANTSSQQATEKLREFTSSLPSA